MHASCLILLCLPMPRVITPMQRMLAQPERSKITHTKFMYAFRCHTDVAFRQKIWPMHMNFPWQHFATDWRCRRASTRICISAECMAFTNNQYKLSMSRVNITISRRHVMEWWVWLHTSHAWRTKYRSGRSMLVISHRFWVGERVIIFTSTTFKIYCKA